MPDDMHVFWIRPMPGVADTARLVVAADAADQTSVVVVLPDNTQVVVSADRAVHIRDGHMLTLGQWQYAPISPDEYYQEPEPPEVEAPEDTRTGVLGGTFTLGGRRTFA
jgi:hypothetical protein